ncbi:MAG: alpha/beta fold hydrolase [Pseudomonadota bacterium]|jgi:pimeloyl-ACP methyl ester carboxylesterase|nr:alpha/beta fold hydrolase [Pseudomonadota bacterium]
MTYDRFADLNGVRICYRQDGQLDAPAIFLIAGLGMQVIEWPEDLIAGLAERFRVIRMDNRDSGLSDRLGGTFTAVPDGFSWDGSPCEIAPYDLGDMAGDVVALADHLGIATFDCLGFSMGGMIAQRIAIRAPERLRLLVSLSSTGGSGALSATPQSRQMMERFFLPFDTSVDAENAIRESNAHFSSGLMTRDSAANGDLARALVARAVDGGGYLRQALAITGTPDWETDLSGAAVPALFVHGDNDPCITPDAARRLAARMPNATFRALPDLGHWVDDRVVEMCLNWLTKPKKTPQGAPYATPEPDLN